LEPGALLLAAAGVVCALVLLAVLWLVLRSRRGSAPAPSSQRLVKGLAAVLAMGAGAVLVVRQAGPVERASLVLEAAPGIEAEVFVNDLDLGRAPKTIDHRELTGLFERPDEEQRRLANESFGRGHRCTGRRCPNVVGLRHNFHAFGVEREDGSSGAVIHKNDLAGGPQGVLCVELRDPRTSETIPLTFDSFSRTDRLILKRYEHHFMFGTPRSLDFSGR
jgi:hypothetical protein